MRACIFPKFVILFFLLIVCKQSNYPQNGCITRRTSGKHHWLHMRFSQWRIQLQFTPTGWLGDINCDSGYNSSEYNFDGGDCIPIWISNDGFDDSSCKIEISCWIGNGCCQIDPYITEASNFDCQDCSFWDRLEMTYFD